MLASRRIWGAMIVATTVLIGAAGALALEPDPALPEVEPGEVVDVAEFSARAQQWSDARRRVREAAIERAEQLASETKLEIGELTVAAAAPSTAEPSVTTTPAASTGPTESDESHASAQSRESSESSTSVQSAESPKAAASESSESGQSPEAESSESLQSGESSESEPAESAEVEESPESAESPEEVVVVEPEAGAGVEVPEGTTLQQWHALRECESRQNYQALNPTGQYRGAYQFSVRTWDWLAGTHYPNSSASTRPRPVPPTKTRWPTSSMRSTAGILGRPARRGCRADPHAVRATGVDGPFGVTPRRSLGQHFVVDPEVVRRIARISGARPGDRVLEIGAGLGSLTLALVETGADVLAVEVDSRCAAALRHVLRGTAVTVIEDDVASLDLDAVLEGGRRWMLVANLPYNIATHRWCWES